MPNLISNQSMFYILYHAIIGYYIFIYFTSLKDMLGLLLQIHLLYY